MSNGLDGSIDSAIVKMAEQAKAQVDPNKALHFSQSALNLANTKAVLMGCSAGDASSSPSKK